MARLALSPRSAILLAVIVLLVVGVVAVFAARASGDGAVSTLTGAPAVPTPGGGGAPAGSVAGGASADGGVGGVGADGADGGAGVGAVSSGSPSPGSSSSPSADASSVVLVHVAGAVTEPGLVRLRAGARVVQAIRAAGGAAGDADLARLNLAEPVVDGVRLYVPHLGETEIPEVLSASDGASGGSGHAPTPGPGSTSSGDAETVDLNTADQAALETLPGIGPALAGRIVAWRDEHGAFRAVDDLLQVNGIGDGRLADLRPRVRV